MRIAKAWWVPPEQVEVLDRLRLHGIRMEEPITTGRTPPLDRVTLRDPVLQPPSDGCVPLRTSLAHERTEAQLPASSARVSTDQPLGLLAAALLEPRSQDSIHRLGFFPDVLQKPPGTEAFVLTPLADALLLRDPHVRAAFDTKLADDPAFAADPSGGSPGLPSGCRSRAAATSSPDPARAVKLMRRPTKTRNRPC